MSKKTSSSLLMQVMFAGCIGVSSGTVSANTYGYTQYWNDAASKLSAHYSQYRFRPLADRVATAPWQSLPGIQSKSVHFQPQSLKRNYTGNNWYRYSQARPLPEYRFRQDIRLTGHQANRPSVIPAFARQYGWSAGPQVNFRRGGSTNYYASESSNPVVKVQSYRSEPVTTQGFNFRTNTRNTEYVSFSERVKRSQQMLSAQVKKPASITRKQPHVLPVQKQLADKPFVVQGNRQQDSYREQQSRGPVIKSRSDVQFRPDQRFIPRVRPDVAVKPTLVQPVSYKLADATDIDNADSRWNDWSFRPVNSTY